MSRKSKVVVITTDGRDRGKHFLIMEMSASKAEKWAARILLLAMQSGVRVPANVQERAGIAYAGIYQLLTGGMRFADVEPLLDEMMACVSYIPDMKNMPTNTRPLIEDDIEEVATRVHLRQEVLELHMGFSIGDGLSSWMSSIPSSPAS